MKEDTLGLAVSSGDIFFASTFDGGCIFKVLTANLSTFQEIVANGTNNCGKVHALAVKDKNVVFTDAKRKQVNTYNLIDKTVKVLSGSGNTGDIDGSEKCAKLTQSTDVQCIYN